jgi:hypothetical protein
MTPVESIRCIRVLKWLGVIPDTRSSLNGSESFWPLGSQLQHRFTPTVRVYSDDFGSLQWHGVAPFLSNRGLFGLCVSKSLKASLAFQNQSLLAIRATRGVKLGPKVSTSPQNHFSTVTEVFHNCIPVFGSFLLATYGI